MTKNNFIPACLVHLTLMFILGSCSSSGDSQSTDAGQDVDSFQAQGSDADSDADADSDVDTDAGSDAGIKNGCGNGINGPVDEVRIIDSYDGERSYRIIVPENYDHETEAPMLLTFHDMGESADQHIELSSLDALSSNTGAVIIALHGLPVEDGGITGWNTGADGGAQEADIPVVIDLIEKLPQQWCIDRDRIYVSGFGMGGFFANRLMFFLDEFLAGGQIEAGDFKSCCSFPRFRRSMIIFHGKDDVAFPLSGGEAIRDYWIRHNELSTIPEVDEYNCEIYRPRELDAGIDAGPYVEVVYCAVENMGHARAGVPSSPGDGTTAPFRATELGWDFISNFSR